MGIVVVVVEGIVVVVVEGMDSEEYIPDTDLWEEGTMEEAL